MKKSCLLLLILVLITVTGCSVPGTANQPVEDDSVTISGTVSVPQVSSSGILAVVGAENSAVSFARFVASSTCRVNGTQVAFSLSNGSRELLIEKLPPAVAYTIELRCGSLKLKSFAASSVRRITLPRGVSLHSTADWHLRAAISSLEGFTIDRLNEYTVNSVLLDGLAATMQNELKKTGISAASYEKSVSDSTTAVLTGKTFADCLQKSGSPFTFNGKFGGKVFYYALNSSGKPVFAVQAVASMTCNQIGNSVNGTFSIDPSAVVPIVENPGINSPSKTAFAFTGTVNNSSLSFVRKGLNNGSPLSGKSLDDWFIFPVRGGLAVRAANLDMSYFTGIQTKSGEFILERK